MNCDRANANANANANDILISYLYGELDAVAEEELERHLRQCPRCHKELSDLRATRALAQSLPEIEPPLGLAAKVLEQARRAVEVSLPPSPGHAVLQIFIFRNGEFLGTEMFSQHRVTIGRDPEAVDLVLDSNQISRKHAMLEHDGASVVIRDLGSTNGVYLGSKKVIQSELGSRDEALVGDYSLKVKLVVRGKANALAPVATANSGLVPTGMVEELSNSDTVAEPMSPSMLERLRSLDDGETVVDSLASLPDPQPEIAPKVRRAAPIDEWDDVSGAFPSLRRKSAGGGRAKKADLPVSRRGDLSEELRGDLSEELRAHLSKEPSAELSEALPESKSEQLQTYDSEADWEADSRWSEGDDDEDANFVPPFSLAAQLVQEDETIVAEGGGDPKVEVITLRGDSVSDSCLLGRGQSFWTGPQLGYWRRRRARDLRPRVRLLRHIGKGQCEVTLPEGVTATLKRGQKRVDVNAVLESGNTSGSRSGNTSGEMAGNRSGNTSGKSGQRMVFKRDEVLDVVDGADRYHIRFVTPPPPVVDRRPLMARVWPDKNMVTAFGSSAGTHFVALVLVYLLVPADLVHSTLRKNDDFVEVTLDAAPRLDEPPPAEKAQEAKEEAPEPAAKSEAKPTQRKPRPGGQSAAPAGVLGLLSKHGSSQAPGPAAALAAVSNLTAARVPGGTAGFKVSGLIGKLPSSSLSVGGGGGGLMTKGGAALLRGGGGGGGLVRAEGKGVGGLVQKNPQAMRSVGQGQLDRDEIQKVINAHIGEIQRCYERELMKTPSLSGKVQVEWTVGTSGGVRSVRQTYTSLESTAVSSCIMGAIRGWTFPKPSGGEVIVTYPFIFKSIGF